MAEANAAIWARTKRSLEVGERVRALVPQKTRGFRRAYRPVYGIHVLIVASFRERGRKIVAIDGSVHRHFPRCHRRSRGGQRYSRAGCWRPRHHVRVCLHGDGGAYAGSGYVRSSHFAKDGRDSSCRSGSQMAPPRLQITSCLTLREWPDGRH